MSQLIAWWRMRAPRERVLLAILAALSASAIYSFGILRPLYSSAEEAKQNYARAMDQSAALLAKVERIEAAGQLGRVPGPASLDDLRASAAAQGLTLQSATSGAGGVSRLTFEDVEAAALVDWLLNLQGTLSVSIDELQIQRSAPGLVAASVSVRQAR